MHKVELKTVYRSTDAQHLVFQNRIREAQPDKATLREYFGDRHWGEYTLDEAVAHGLRIGRERDSIFTWLTATNKGASEVCEAALRHLGISAADLAKGLLPDPTSKSKLRILGRPGLVLRLTRNLDKQRGV